MSARKLPGSTSRTPVFQPTHVRDAFSDPHVAFLCFYTAYRLVPQMQEITVSARKLPGSTSGTPASASPVVRFGLVLLTHINPCDTVIVTRISQFLVSF